MDSNRGVIQHLMEAQIRRIVVHLGVGAENEGLRLLVAGLPFGLASISENVVPSIDEDRAKHSSTPGST